MSEIINADICVIGAGSGGLSVAAGASQMGANVVLLERGKMGGDCLNSGCVPSKALLAAAHAAEDARRAKRFGVNVSKVDVDFARVNQHVHDTIAAIEPNDSVERFTGLGVNVIQASGRLTGPNEVSTDDHVINARRIVIATGSSAGVPPIEGLDNVSFYTNENIFDITECPEHLIVIGGGPIGMEMAQAHQRLGAKVTVVEMFKAMGKDDPEFAEIVLKRVREEGVEILEETGIARVSKNATGVTVTVKENGSERDIQGSHLLVAAGRRANVDGLNLEAAGVEYSAKGIRVDARLRTSNTKIFAIGDVAGGYQFTHMAGYHAGIVIRNALFRLPAKVNYKAVPWVTYTDPELAHVGLSEAEAREKHGDVTVLRWSFEENDRAQAEANTEGLLKVITSKRGKILGATMAATHAGELIQPWILAISQGMKIGAMASYIAPYPTLSEVNKRAAGSYYTASLFGPRTKAVVKFLSWFG